MAAPRLVGQSVVIDRTGRVSLKGSEDERAYVEEVDIDSLKKMRSEQRPRLIDRFPSRYLT